MPRFLVSAARYARAVRRRRQVSRFRSTPRFRRSLEYRDLLGSDRLAALFASHRSGRTARKHFFPRGLLRRHNPKVPATSHFAPFGSSGDVPRFAPFRPNHPKALRPSRFAPPGLPESRPGIASTPPGLARRSTRASRVGRRRPGAIIRRVSAIPTTGVLRRSNAEASDPRFAASVPFPSPRFPGSNGGDPQQLTILPPEGIIIVFRSVRYVVRPSRLRAPFGRSRAAVPTSKPLALTLRIGRAFRRSSS